MKDKDVKFINGGKKLDFDLAGFAINPFDGKNAFAGSDFRDLLIGLVGSGTVVLYGSMQEKPVDFSLPSTIDNLYAPIVLADYSVPNTYYAGSAGVTVAGGATKIVELNTNILTWIGIQRSGTGVEVKMTETNAQ